MKVEETIKIFLENTTKGYEFRKELFNKISSELYNIFYKDKQVDFDIDSVFDAWLNLAGGLGDNFECLKILFFVVKNQSKFKKYQVLGAKGILLNEKWLDYFNDLTAQEALILHKVINIGSF